ncbi:MAG: 4-alpha-glucanotransferase [Oscillospiraceae bacterium]
MRKSGILLHIASLPNSLGIGTMGAEAYSFADYLKASGQTLWQILPLSPTSYGDSPYQSFSIYAGNPYLISLETLEDEGLLLPEEYRRLAWRESGRYIDYGVIYKTFFAVMKKAFTRFVRHGAESSEYRRFLQNNAWLDDYALFMALKSEHGGAPWNEWEPELRTRRESALNRAKERLADEIEFQRFMQFEFFRQWFRLKEYVNSLGIEIIGDMPIYTAYDSVDVWCEPRLFQLDEELMPAVVAGFPPDGFSPEGQLWGNPIYDWERMKSEDFRWWTDRMAFAKKLYDIVRIDHFLGLDRYYAIPFGEKSARYGSWHEGPRYPLFEAIERKTGSGGILAEDLGILTPSAERLLKQTGCPRMKVLQFAFSPEGASEFLPQNYSDTNCAVYTATHDNDTVAGWVKTADKPTLRFCREYLGVWHNADIPWAMIRLAWNSTAQMSLTTIQDMCGYASEARINTPSTLGGNWRWRAISSDFSQENSRRLKRLTELSNRGKGEPK